MSANKVYRAIGLMSGTCLDGEIDVALIETDGHDYVKPLRFYTHPYAADIRDRVRAIFGKTSYDNAVEDAEELVTDIHIEAVRAFDEKADVIGFHGQTITHDPELAFTWQIGDGQRLAREVGMDVVYDMRQSDIKGGGQGAPLLPLYHAALLAAQEKPLVVLNLGGVSNITYIGENGEMIAFDCGPGNALMDDFIKSRTGEDFDVGGRLAARGQAHETVLNDFLRHPYFAQKPPKSLDRNHWTIQFVRYCSDEDGMATLLEMTIAAIHAGLSHLPQKPKAIYVAGGGRKNKYLLDSLQNGLQMPVQIIDDLGFNGDAIEAEGFAYLAVRSLLGLPLTLPQTTGVRAPMVGGVLARAA